MGVGGLKKRKPTNFFSLSLFWGGNLCRCMEEGRKARERGGMIVEK